MIGTTRLIKRIIGFTVIIVLIAFLWTTIHKIINRSFKDSITINKLPSQNFIIHPIYTSLVKKGNKIIINEDKFKVSTLYVQINTLAPDTTDITLNDDFYVATITDSHEGLTAKLYLLKQPDLKDAYLCYPEQDLKVYEITPKIYRILISEFQQIYYTDKITLDKGKICFYPGLYTDKIKDGFLFIEVMDFKNANAVYFLDSIIKNLILMPRYPTLGSNYLILANR